MMIAPNKVKVTCHPERGAGLGRERSIPARPVDLRHDLCGDPSFPPEPPPSRSGSQVGGFGTLDAGVGDRDTLLKHWKFLASRCTCEWTRGPGRTPATK